MIAIELEVVEPLGRMIARPWADAVTGVQIDSRRIREGDLFVAVGGGSDFVEHALARGASAALVPRDAHAALAELAAAVRSRSKARIVGITGSTGKTSTKDILFALCAPHAATIANEGNFNNELGVPLTLCRLEPETEICISEMGDARTRADRAAGRDGPARHRRDHQHRAGPPRAGRDGRERRTRQGRADRCPACGRHRRRPRRAAARAVPDALRHRGRARRSGAADPVRDELSVRAPAREHAHGDRHRAVPRRATADRQR